VPTEAAHWDAAYADGDEDRSWTEDEPADSLEAIAATGVPLDAPLLDVGCGSSRLAGRLLANGHTDITVLDLSAVALELARRRLGDEAEAVRWIAADLLTWRPERAYAVWHDRAVLHFFTAADDRRRYADTLCAALAPGGYAIIATFAPHGPQMCSGLPVIRSSAEEILSLLGAQFTARRMSVREHRTPSGSLQPFTWVVVQRSSDPHS
jgi:trans-aconitate methyltransferase